MYLLTRIGTKRLKIRVTPSTNTPTSPSGLTTTAISSTEIDLSWTDNSSNEIGFQIQRSPDGTAWTTLTTVVANTTSYADKGLAPATTYFYRVSAFNGTGNSAPSGASSASTTGSSISLTSGVLAANAATYGGPPYVLNQANTKYTLATDIATPGSSFMITAANIALEENGHTITYNNDPRPTITNPFFETDAIGTTANPGDGITGWTVTGALQAAIVAASDGVLQYPYGRNIYGTQVLKFTVPAAKVATITTSLPGVAALHCIGHGCSTGDYVFLDQFVSTPSLITDVHQVTVVDADNFTIPTVTLTAVSDSAGVMSRATVIQSDPVSHSLPTGRCVSASFDSANETRTVNSHAVKIELWQDGALLADQSSSGINVYRSPIYTINNRALTPVTVTKLTSTNPITIRWYLGQLETASGSRTVWAGRAALAPSHDAAIIASFRGIAECRYAVSLPAAIQTLYSSGSNRPSGFVVEDGPFGALATPGAIIQGAGQGSYCTAIFADRCAGVKTVRDISVAINGDSPWGAFVTSLNGADTAKITIGGSPGRGLTVTYADGLSIGNRFAYYPAVNADFVGGPLEVSYNTISDGVGDTVVALPTSTTGGYPLPISAAINIHDNTLSLKAVCGNVYAITVMANAIVHDNTIDAYTASGAGGRGIIVAANDNNVVQNVEVYGNTCLISELGDKEYGQYDPVRALRVRISGVNAVVVNVNVHDNTFAAVTTSTGGYPASGAMVDIALGGRVATITSTTGNPAVVNVPGYTFTVGEEVYLYYFNTTPSINGFQTVTAASGNSFTLGTTLTVIGSPPSGQTFGVQHGAIVRTMMTPGNHTFRNNIFRGITTFAGSSLANGIEMGYIQAPLGQGLIFEGNTIDSNQAGLALDVLGAIAEVDSAVYGGTTFNKNTTFPGAVALAYNSLLAAGAGPSFPIAGNVVSSQFTGGATDSPSFTSSTTKAVNEGWRATITVHDTGGHPISGATVTITNSLSATNSTGTTDANGVVSGMLILVSTYSGTTTASLTSHSPHTLTVSAAGHATSVQSLGTITADVTTTVVLS